MKLGIGLRVRMKDLEETLHLMIGNLAVVGVLNDGNEDDPHC